eukprot:TRINITY_DN11149_c0_g1_i1.p1 TRINITY_DN11149_c0_g1~~TRINITY_DN11149_c0_g1_i1.p1  ORF type:complete len:402 (+),score=114.52 TRINITY_DN11149_c0_g1_i1:116-1207(+)
MSRAGLCAALPKCELHIHLDGTMEPEQLLAMATRNSIDVPWKSVEEARKAFDFKNLQEFLDVLYIGAAVVCTPDDLYEMAMEHAKRMAAPPNNVHRAEVFVNPQSHVNESKPAFTYKKYFDALRRVRRDAREQYSIRLEFISSILRHLGGEAGLEVVNATVKYIEDHRAEVKGTPSDDDTMHPIGVGLDSSEIGFPPSLFEEAYRVAREANLHVVAHAGEEGGPEMVWEALNLLKAERIDHGLASLKDASLVDHLVHHRTPLTVCPFSNVALQVVPSLADHPLKQMLDLGINASINSDDPCYFKIDKVGQIGHNYLATAEALDLTRDEVILIAKNGFESAFLSADAKAEYLNEIDRVAAEHVW